MCVCVCVCVCVLTVGSAQKRQRHDCPEGEQRKLKQNISRFIDELKIDEFLW